MNNWTPERVNRLKVLWAQGLTCSAIARELGGVSRNAVIGKVQRLALPGRVKERAHRTGRVRPKPAQKIKIKPAPAHKPIPWTRPEGPKRDEAVNVRFIERQTDQCAMFVADECGPDGLVCGRPVVRGAYCCECSRLAYQPLKLADAA